MSLQILVAGVDKDGKSRVEAAIRDAFGLRGEYENWTISLVRMGRQWSVTVSGADERFKNISFVTDEASIGERITQALEEHGAGEAKAPAPVLMPSLGDLPPSELPPSDLSRRDSQNRYACVACQQQFTVTYDKQPDEPLVIAAVACPHCWHINHIEMGAWAAEGNDYRAEKV